MLCSKCLEALEPSFARKRSMRYTGQVIMHAKYPVTSGIIEGCMNTIKVLKRTAWGFRDFEYFFLRIKYTFLPYALKEKVKDKLFRDRKSTRLNSSHL